MNHYPHPVIAREGWPFLGIAVVAALIATHFLGGWSWPFWVIAIFVLQFFRDPPRTIPQDANAVRCRRPMAVSWSSRKLMTPMRTAKR